MVGCAVVEAAGTGAGLSVAGLWIQSWAGKSVILAKVLSPGERDKFTSNRDTRAIMSLSLLALVQLYPRQKP